MLTIYFLIIISTLLWFLLKHVYSYWERKGFPYIKPHIPFGNLKSTVKGEKSFGIAIYDLYKSTKEPFTGIYLLFRPALLIKDAELVKSILTKDFASFHDRGIYSKESDLISQNLFSLPGLKWKQLRSKLSPAFSSGKIKSMFETIENVSKTMTDYMNFRVPMGGNEGDSAVVDMKDVCHRYAIDIIANVIFGLDVNSFAEPNNNFRTTTKRLNSPGFIEAMRNIGLFICPGLFKILPVPAFDPIIKNFMINIVEKTISYRESTNYVRKDLMQLLLQLRNSGKLNLDDDIWSVESVAETLKSMPIEVCAAQAFLFYVAGTETTSLTISYCLHELTQNPKIMEKLLKDIDEALEKHNGRITYDSIHDMKYLELCVLETMRKYPGLPILNRECTEDFNIPDTKYVIEKGTPIIISLLGLHLDPKYFPEPLKFIPERYIEGEKNYVESAYLPFGDGPRACIAIRLGKVNVKVALAMLLTKYEFEATEKKEIEYEHHTVGIIPKGGINLRVKRRKRRNVKN